MLEALQGHAWKGLLGPGARASSALQDPGELPSRWLLPFPFCVLPSTWRRLPFIDVGPTAFEAGGRGLGATLGIGWEGKFESRSEWLLRATSDFLAVQTPGPALRGRSESLWRVERRVPPAAGGAAPP